MMMLLRVVFSVILLIVSVAANTEAFYFQIPNSYNSSTVSTYPKISIDEVNDIEFVVPSPNSQDHLRTWYEVEGDTTGFFNARISWSALDPIQIIHFDFEEIDDQNQKGLFLYLEVKYDCYTKDRKFMENEHQVGAKIRELFPRSMVSSDGDNTNYSKVISSTYLFIPKDILPNLGIIVSLAIVGYGVHGYIFELLKSLS